MSVLSMLESVTVGVPYVTYPRIILISVELYVSVAEVVFNSVSVFVYISAGPWWCL